MKRIFTLFLIGWLTSLAAFCQKAPDSSKSLHFIYIAHSVETLIGHVDQEFVQPEYTNVAENEQRAIIYLANAENPIIIPMGFEKDDYQKYNEIFRTEMNSNSHEVYPTYDLQRIVELFNEYNFVDKDGNLLYSSVTLDFFVNSQFWDLGGANSLLSPLMFALDVKRYAENDNFTCRFLASELDSDLQYDEEHPFGLKNLGELKKVIIQRY